MKAKILLAVVLLLLIVFFQAAYVVDETEQVIITQFGKPVGSPITDPGIGVKIPLIQKITYFPKNLLEWDGDPDEIPTNDKKYIWVDTFARWKIVDPLLFFQTVNNIGQAQNRLSEIINSAVRDFIAAYPLIELVRLTNREFVDDETADDKISEKTVLAPVTTGRKKIIQGVLGQVEPELMKFGIQVVDVAIKRLNYTEKVRNTVYGRMIAEREQIAEKFRSEGEGEARKIEGNRVKELKRITSEAYKTAEEIKGKADAEATLIYAKAYSKDPDFYSFLKSLHVYEEALAKDTSLVLSTDSEFLRYLKGYKKTGKK
jgi:membrane protease subunit HflC